MTSLLSILIGFGLNYLPISVTKRRIIFLASEFLTGGVL